MGLIVKQSQFYNDLHGRLDHYRSQSVAQLPVRKLDTESFLSTGVTAVGYFL